MAFCVRITTFSYRDSLLTTIYNLSDQVCTQLEEPIVRVLGRGCTQSWIQSWIHFMVLCWGRDVQDPSPIPMWVYTSPTWGTTPARLCSLTTTTMSTLLTGKDSCTLIRSFTMMPEQGSTCCCMPRTKTSGMLTSLKLSRSWVSTNHLLAPRVKSVSNALTSTSQLLIDIHPHRPYVIDVYSFIL